MEWNSALQRHRYQYKPKLPAILQKNLHNVIVEKGEPTESVADQEQMKQIFAKTYGKPIVSFKEGANSWAEKAVNVGVILSGGQAPGGHNVIAGLFDGIKSGNKNSKLIGFLGGPSGILDNKYIELTHDYVDKFRNTGGFNIIGSGRTKLESEEQFDTCIQVCKKHDISAIVVIGGDDSNTNGALMAEYFEKQGAPIQVIGVPKTIDGDLKNEHIEISFGFDTATKTYSELIGNIARDAQSAKKYWHFIKLMGRSASHIALECAISTKPNHTIISEEVKARQQTLNQIVDETVDVIVKRSENGENFGIVLVPEGLIEFVPEMGRLINELNDLLAENSVHFSTLNTFESQAEWINKNLSKDSSYVFSSLPNDIQRQLLMDRDPHGNVQVSRIETEKLIIELVESKLKELKNSGKYQGKFSSQHHFFGYEGRCAFPTNFDADYCYSLGVTAYVLIANGLTAYMSAVKNLFKPAEDWVPGGIPLTMMMNLEQRHGKLKPVIQKALVELNGKPFLEYQNYREEWAIKTLYKNPGAVQYYGPDEVCNETTKTLRLEQG